FGRGVEPNTDIAIACAEFRGEVFDGRTRFASPIQAADNPLLELTGRRRVLRSPERPWTADRRLRAGGQAPLSLDRGPPGFHPGRDSGSGRRTEPALPT